MNRFEPATFLESGELTLPELNMLYNAENDGIRAELLAGEFVFQWAAEQPHRFVLTENNTLVHNVEGYQ